MEGEQVSISVVITTYNRAAMLDDALASVAASHADDRRTVEVLVIDNNSADNTAEVVAARQPEFPFPLFYFMEPRQGLSYARNRGISEAEGKYLVFMDDDQILDPQYLRTVPVAFEESDAACVACRLIYRCDENAPEWFNEIGRVHGEQDFGESAMTLHHDQHTVLGGTMSFRRSDLIAAGSFNVHLGRKGTQLLSGEDSEMQRRLAALGKAVVYYPKLVQYHYLNPERLHKRYWRRLYIGYGRSRYTQTAEKWACAKRIMNIPRTFLWQLLVQDIPKYITSLAALDFIRAFQRELYIWRRIGLIRESRKFRPPLRLFKR